MNGNLQQLMMIAGMGLLCWMLMRGKMRGRAKHELMVIPQLGHNSNARLKGGNNFSGTQSLGAPAEVLKWQVELHDLGRELKAELDSKLVAVRSLTISYDQAAKRLSELIRMAEAVKLDEASPLAEARRLQALGWDKTKIAKAIAMEEREVAQLLSL